MRTKKDRLRAMRHSCEHVLTQAMLKLYPTLVMAMGPATDEGFYFDFEAPPAVKISEADFPRIEKEMQKIIDRNLPIKKEVLPVKEARKLFANNPYKQEWLDEIAKRGEQATVYWTGKEFVDLCAGPHLKSTGEIGAFKLLSVAGAYWRGSEKNKMLTRIYGTAFPTKKELKEYLERLAEAKKYDHRRLGKKLGIFTLTPQVGPGLLIWTPAGAVIRHEIENLIYEEQVKRGYQHVYTPHIGRKKLWVTSGHWALYRDKMYAPMKIDQEDYLVKPMNCPFHMMIYQSKPRSYRELPLRIAEIASVYRYEKAGELSGMLRVRYITQDDAHIFCQPNQVIEEFLGVFDYVVFLLKTFGFQDYRFRVSTRDPQNKNKYLGDDQIWEESETKIITAVKKKGVPYSVAKGEAAFYGPKLDIIIKDVLGREWQCGTIQIDFMLPERFQLEYTDAQGQKKRPVLIHRAPLGSLERWVGMLIEHYKGAFPFWLAPLQIKLLPISEKQLPYAQKILTRLREERFRAETDSSRQTLSYRIRQGELEKTPFLLVVGEREEKEGKVTVRQRGGKEFLDRSLDWFVKQAKKLRESRSLKLLETKKA